LLPLEVYDPRGEPVAGEGLALLELELDVVERDLADGGGARSRGWRRDGR
jgi:hypothetical protein